MVDQFEELFTAGEGAGAGAVERAAFVTALHAAATVPAGPGGLPPALVVVAVRADYLGHLIADPPLKAALDAGPFTVGPMSEAELRLAVTGPAAEAGLVVEPAVVEAVITELRGEAGGGLGSGVLPLMSQAMAATWERREGNELTLRGYRRAGGVADAVNRGAQAAYDALTRPQKDAARLVFTQLTVITADGRFARRRCRRADLRSPGTQMAADIDAVIGVFAARRLLVLGHDSVEIAHDALLQAWKQLRDWLADDQLGRALYGQVVTDADTWDSNGRDPAYLYRPGRLATIDAAAARWRDGPARYPPLPATGEAFLGAARHAARRATRRRRGVIAGLLALTVIAVSAAGIAVRDAANASRQAANAARQHAIALSRQLAAESVAAESTHPLTARRLAAAAWRIFPTDQAGSALAGLLMEQQQGGILPGNPANGGALAVAFSPDGKLLATGYGNGYVRLWDPATGQAIGSPLLADTSPQGEGGVGAVAFSPDGKLLATAGGDGYVRLWNPVTGQAAGAPLPACRNGGVERGWRSARTASCWPPPAATGTCGCGTRPPDSPSAHPSRLTPSPDGVNAVAFSPDGKLLASADADGTVRLWNPATGQPVGSPLPAVTRPGAGVGSVAFSPDGKLLASGGRRVRAAVEPGHRAARRRSPSAVTSGGRRWVLGVAFSPDGKLLASAAGTAPCGCGTRSPGSPSALPFGLPIPAWRAACPRWRSARTASCWPPPARRRCRAAVEPGHPASSPRAPAGCRRRRERGGVQPRRQAAGQRGSDGTVRLWDPATQQAAGAPLPAETGSGAHVFGVAFSPDGKLLATADGDGTVGLWNPATQQASGVFPGIKRMAFSPDGKLLATAEADDSVRMWDLATRQAIGAPLPADYGGGVNGVAFSPDGKLLATAYSDGSCGYGTRPPDSPPALPSGPATTGARERGGVQPGRQAPGQPPAATAPCGCGTRPPGRPPALFTRLSLGAA